MDLSQGKNISEELGKLKKEAEERDAERRADKEKLPYVKLSSSSVNLDVLKLIPEEKARKVEAAAIEVRRKELALAVYDPLNPETKKLIEEFRSEGREVNLFISSLGGLARVWERYKEIKAAPEKGALEGVEIQETEVFKNLTFENILQKIQEMDRRAGGAPTTELVDLILGSAITLGASDIHLETEKTAALLRFRIDGLLYDVCRLNRKTYTSLLGRLKLLSGLKINITDAPQDGRFTTKFGGDLIEVRTSVVPAEYGETVVLRVLDPHTISLELVNLGLRPDDEEIIQLELKRPNGTILVTGPTGSGKTTTLYAFLKAVKNSELKVITIEDPVEYHLEGIEQTQVDPESGYTFSSGLRSILRQDPDIILVGEIRDLETAEIGMHAALTGHLVFSTLHTNDAAGAIPRLVDLGAKPSIIGPAINLIIAQRLVRRLCGFCKVPVGIESDKKKKIEKFLSELPERAAAYAREEIKLYSSKGCDKCRGGFKGRLGVFEFLKFGDELKSLIAEEATEEAIKKLGRNQGMVEMQADGILKAVAGETTLEEVERVTGPIEWL